MLKDANDTSPGKVGSDVAASKGEGSVTTDWMNPITHKAQPKVTFSQKAGDDVCGVGAYNS